MERIQLRRDLAAKWAEINPILMEGEVGFEIDTKLRKIGDGVTAWNNLDYLAAENIVQELGDSTTATISQEGISVSNILQTFNNTSKITQSEIKLVQCVVSIQLTDFDTYNESEEWKLLQFGYINSSNSSVFYFQRVRDQKLVEYEFSGKAKGIINYNTFVNNLHINLTFDWDKYVTLFPTMHYYPSLNNFLCIDVKKGIDNAITNKGFYITNGNLIRNDNIQISECFHNFKLYDYNFDGSGYEFYQQGWLPSVGHPIFYYKKIGTEDVILFDDTTITVKPTGVKHHLYDNGIIRVEFDFDWDLFFKYFPTDCYRRREGNYLTVNAVDFKYVGKLDKVIPSINTNYIKQDKEYASVSEFFRNKYVVYNKPAQSSSILNTLTISTSRSGWTNTPELVKLNLIVGVLDQRNTLVNPKIFTYSLSELKVKYPSNLYTTIDLSDKNIIVNKGEVVGVLSGSLATNDFIFLVSRGSGLSNDVYISGTIDGIFSTSYDFVKFEVTLDSIDSVFALQDSVDTLQTEVNSVSKTLSQVSANILIDTVTGVKYKLQVSNGILNVKSIDYSNILVIGTSQVNPEPAPTYGWYVNRTMAASVYGHATADYLLRGIQKRNTQATLHLMNDYLWQRNYDDFDYSQYDSTITSANPDVIYLITGGNSTYTSTFKTAFGQYLDYLKTIAPNADIYVLVGWYGATKASDMIEECVQRGISYTNISANRNIYNTWTVGDYYLGDDADTYYPITNTSVGSHPNDMGHYENAEALLEASLQSSNDDLVHNITLNTTKVTAEIVNSRWIESGIMTIRILSGEVTSISVKDSDNNSIAITSRTNDNNTEYNVYYTFVMPNKDVTITIN